MDAQDPQAVSEFAQDCQEWMIQTEAKFKPTQHCLLNQKDIHKKMRLILVGWLIEVHLKFKLLPETLFLTINILDRYCERTQV